MYVPIVPTNDIWLTRPLSRKDSLNRDHHSSEFRSLCLMKNVLQSFPYFLNVKIHIFFLSNKYPGQCQHREVRKEKGGNICVSIFWLGHFIKHIPLIFKGWIFILSLYLFLSFKTPTIFLNYTFRFI